MLLPKLGGSRLLPPWDFPHLYVRVTLWTTTAFHLDTPNMILLKNKNANLRRTRDFLLPELIRGVVHVSNIDVDVGG